jgi:hypothetical protein
MNIVNFYNPGAIIDRLPDDVFDKLKEIIEQKRMATNTLDTIPKRNLQLLSIKEIIETPYIQELDNFIRQTYLNWCHAFNTNPSEINVGPVWTNYMQRSEYTPVHNHAASDLAFVIWVKIPYNLKEEQEQHFDHSDLYPTREGDGKENTNGMFKFMYSTYTGQMNTHVITLGKEMEGHIVMFPGIMYHIAYPFFSTNEERISVAGNIMMKR